jgi:predicted ABC-type ATPase
MADKVTIELSSDYAEHLELLKQIIPSANGEQITDNSKMVEALIDSFMAFIQEQAGAEEEQSGGGCGG